MSLFPTLRITPKKKSQTGNPQAQPKTSHSSVVKHATQASSTTNKSARQISTDVQIDGYTSVKASGDTLTVNTSTSVNDALANLKADPTFTTPAAESNVHGSSLTPSYKTSKPSFDSHQEPNLEFNESTRKFTPYEKLFGISHTRPEIVMLTQFLPLFDNAQGHSQPQSLQLITEAGIHPRMSDAGHFLETQIAMRNLKVVNVLQAIQSVSKGNSVPLDLLQKASANFNTHARKLKGMLQFVVYLVHTLELQKTRFDLHARFYDVEPQRVINNYEQLFTQSKTNHAASVALDKARQFMPNRFSVGNTLETYGYKHENVSSLFTSSKLWMQLLIEYRNLLRNHSRHLMGIPSLEQGQDNNPASLTVPTAQLLNPNGDPANLIGVAALAATNESAITDTVKTIMNAYDGLYGRYANFKTPEMKIVALVNLISVDYRYSYGLSLDEVKTILNDDFGYVVNEHNNHAMWDKVIGLIRNNVTKMPVVNDNSLMDLAQRRPTADTAVLTFETSYFEEQGSEITPGVEYFVSNTLNVHDGVLDTTNAQQLGHILNNMQSSFKALVNDLRILSTLNVDPSKRSLTEAIVADTGAFTDLLLDVIVDRNKGETLDYVKNDNITALYARAAKDRKLKSLLFLYNLARITRPSARGLEQYQSPSTNDNIAATSEIIKQIDSSLRSSLPVHVSSTLLNNIGRRNKSKQQANDTLTTLSSTLVATLKTGTPLIKQIDMIMSTVLLIFSSQGALNQTHTRYNGMLDTAMMMTVFDVLVEIISQYGNISLIGKSVSTSSTVSYVSVKSKRGFKQSLNAITSRVNRELMQIQRTTYTVFNTLDQLHNSLSSFATSLSTSSTTEHMKKIMTMLNDPNLLKMFMSEQQIMLFANRIDELLDRMSLNTTQNAAFEGQDADHDGKFDAFDEVRMLEDLTISPRFRDLILATFSSDQYAQSKAFNKKIVTVGIPQGFVQNLKRVLDTEKLGPGASTNKQSDIVNVSVYKVDMLNQGIIYKPQRFLFELSRFAVRNANHYKAVSQHASLSDIVAAIPTRDFGTTSADITYWDPARPSKSGPFKDQSYAFLTNYEKAEIAKNHVISMLLESYVNIMTGVSVSEDKFDAVPLNVKVNAELFNTMLDISVFNASSNTNSGDDVSDGVIFSTTTPRDVGLTSKGANADALDSAAPSNQAGTGGHVRTSSQFKAIKQNTRAKSNSAQKSTSVTNSHRNDTGSGNTAAIISALQSYSTLKNVNSTVSDPTDVSKKLLMPKQFDRIFNVMIDPDEFEIDYDKTTATEFGRKMLNTMITNGDVISSNTSIDANIFAHASKLPLHQIGAEHVSSPKPGQTWSTSQDVNNYKFRDRDRTQGDMMFEKYIVTIETYEERNN